MNPLKQMLFAAGAALVLLVAAPAQAQSKAKVTARIGHLESPAQPRDRRYRTMKVDGVPYRSIWLDEDD